MIIIGPHTFHKPFILAPLAGYTDLPFRLLCKKFGAAYTVSEMISCYGLTYHQKRTIDMLATVDTEKPVAFQLFGSDPDVMEDAAQILESYRPDFIDINMGCPVKKVTKKGAGAALMSTPKVAETILRKVVSAVSIPVTVKFRAGVDNTNRNGVEFGLMAQDCGVSALIVHGRTWKQAFSGSSSLASIREVKKAVTIPVIGNGDVTTQESGYYMMSETGCDGVMVGRAALGNPWIFSENGRPGDLNQIVTVALEHLALIEKHLPYRLMLGHTKNHMCKYFRGIRNSSFIRKAIFDTKSHEDLKTLLISIN